MSEAQATYATLMQVDKLLSDIELRINNITQQVGGGGGAMGGPSLRQELRVMNGYMIAIQKWSGSDTLANAINTIQAFNAALIRGYMLLEALNDIYLASSLNPFLIAYAGAHALGFVISVQNLVGQ